MGLEAAFEWVGLMALFALGAYLYKDSGFLYQCAALSANLLVYRVLAFMPFGGGRVWGWNKAAFAVFAVATAGLILPVML